MSSAIQVKNLTVAYREPVLESVSLEIPQGVVAAVVGPNGAGKTSLMKAVLGLLQPVAGVVTILGKKGIKNQRFVAYVPQRATVDWDFPVTVLDVALMGCYRQMGWFCRPGSDEKERAINALEQVGLARYEHRHISQLSGGERQRVFLARALMQEAQLYVMDEPFIGVDAVTEQMIVKVLQNLRQQGKTIVVVHHDLQTLQEYFDWIVLLNKKVIASGPLQEVFTRENIKQTYGVLPYFLALQEQGGG